MEKEKNANTKSAVLITILVMLVIALAGYIAYDKFLSTDTTKATENNKQYNESKTNDNKTVEEKDSYIKTRKCTGKYTGSAAIGRDVVTSELEKGNLTIELKEDGTYTLEKENSVNVTGEYTIIENTLLLKTASDTCGPDIKCTTNYSQYLNINEDCTKISTGYGSYFFSSDFTLEKHN